MGFRTTPKYTYTLQVKDLISLELVIQKQYLRMLKTRFYWVFGLAGIDIPL